MTSESSGRLWRLCRKELRETLRDRRTILTLVLMPLILYPLLSMTLQRFLYAATPPDGQTVYRIAVASDRQASAIDSLLQTPLSQPPPVLLQANDGALARFDLITFDQATPLEALRAQVVDLAIEFDPDGGDAGQPRFQIWADRGHAASLQARRIFVERVMWYRLASAETHSPLVPPELALETIGGTASQSPLLGTLVPLVLVLMTITGAVYPAIDLTAGERERGTIEALMASPIPRGQILVAKYVAVVTVAMLTAIVNLAAMLATLSAGGMLSLLAGEHQPLSWLMLLRVLGLLVLFASFFSAVLLCLTSFARSFKEAQAYLIPLMLLALAPGIASLFPGIELTLPLAVVPLVNVVFLARDLIAGEVAAVTAAAAVISTLGYATAALFVAARLFGNNAILRGSELSSSGALRRPRRSSDCPQGTATALTVAMLFPVYFLVSSYLAQQSSGDPADAGGDDGWSMQTRLLASGAALALIFGGLPLLSAWYGRNRLVTTFRLRNRLRPAAFALACLGTLLMGLGLWAAAHEAFVLTTGQLPAERVEAAQAAIDQLQAVPLAIVLLTLAVAPGVIEELCFRGYLFSACRQVLSPWRTIWLTSFLFGLFHVLTGNMLLWERMVPTTLMGVFLGWVAYRTGSVWPGMILHTVHNGFLNTVGRFRDSLGFLGQVDDSLGHLPPLWLAVAAAVALSGMALVALATPAGPAAGDD